MDNTDLIERLSAIVPYPRTKQGALAAEAIAAIRALEARVKELEAEIEELWSK